MISKRTIEEVFDTARVEEVIGEFVQLKKSGSNFKGLSPFTEEKTPSFMVSPAKQIWKDFSSGKGGTAVTFLMEHEQYTTLRQLNLLLINMELKLKKHKKHQNKSWKMMRKKAYFLFPILQKIISKNPYFLRKGKALA